MSGVHCFTANVYNCEYTYGTCIRSGLLAFCSCFVLVLSAGSVVTSVATLSYCLYLIFAAAMTTRRGPFGDSVCGVCTFGFVEVPFLPSWGMALASSTL